MYTDKNNNITEKIILYKRSIGENLVPPIDTSPIRCITYIYIIKGIIAKDKASVPFTYWLYAIPAKLPPNPEEDNILGVNSVN